MGELTALNSKRRLSAKWVGLFTGWSLTGFVLESVLKLCKGVEADGRGREDRRSEDMARRDKDANFVEF